MSRALWEEFARAFDGAEPAGYQQATTPAIRRWLFWLERERARQGRYRECHTLAPMREIKRGKR